MKLCCQSVWWRQFVWLLTDRCCPEDRDSLIKQRFSLWTRLQTSCTVSTSRLCETVFVCVIKRHIHDMMTQHHSACVKAQCVFIPSCSFTDDQKQSNRTCVQVFRVHLQVESLSSAAVSLNQQENIHFLPAGLIFPAHLDHISRLCSAVRSEGKLRLNQAGFTEVKSDQCVMFYSVWVLSLQDSSPYTCFYLFPLRFLLWLLLLLWRVYFYDYYCSSVCEWTDFYQLKLWHSFTAQWNIFSSCFQLLSAAYTESHKAQKTPAAVQTSVHRGWWWCFLHVSLLIYLHCELSKPLVLGFFFQQLLIQIVFDGLHLWLSFLLFKSSFLHHPVGET